MRIIYSNACNRRFFNGFEAPYDNRPTAELICGKKASKTAAVTAILYSVCPRIVNDLFVSFGTKASTNLQTVITQQVTVGTPDIPIQASRLSPFLGGAH